MLRWGHKSGRDGRWPDNCFLSCLSRSETPAFFFLPTSLTGGDLQCVDNEKSAQTISQVTVCHCSCPSFALWSLKKQPQPPLLAECSKVLEIKQTNKQIKIALWPVLPEVSTFKPGFIKETPPPQIHTDLQGGMRSSGASPSSRFLHRRQYKCQADPPRSLRSLHCVMKKSRPSTF